MIPELHCGHNPSPGQLDSGTQGKEVPSRGSPCSPALSDPFSEMPVMLAGRVRSPALGALPSRSPRAGSSLTLSGTVLPTAHLSLQFCPFCSLPHDGGSIFPISHLSGGQAASPVSSVRTSRPVHR